MRCGMMNSLGNTAITTFLWAIGGILEEHPDGIKYAKILDEVTGWLRGDLATMLDGLQIVIQEDLVNKTTDPEKRSEYIAMVDMIADYRQVVAVREIVGNNSGSEVKYDL